MLKPSVATSRPSAAPAAASAAPAAADVPQPVVTPIDTPADAPASAAPRTPDWPTPAAPVFHEAGSIDLQALAKAAATRAERDAIEAALGRFRWNRRKAAEYLNVSYKTLLNKIKETGIQQFGTPD
ncbi:MAG: helix-turn-helix domain-containing protein [Vicinamibacterales bacterium]